VSRSAYADGLLAVWALQCTAAGKLLCTSVIVGVRCIPSEVSMLSYSCLLVISCRLLFVIVDDVLLLLSLTMTQQGPDEGLSFPKSSLIVLVNQLENRL